MSLQVFLQAQLLGAEKFLAAPPPPEQDGTADLFGRCAWLNLYCEVLPRALLNQLKLSRMLLGVSSAEQFLLVLPEEEIPRADEFLERAADAVARFSNDQLRLLWASTENLGTWPVARKRLEDALVADASAPLRAKRDTSAFFAPFAQTPSNSGSYFADFAKNLPSATKVGWSADYPAHLAWDAGEFSWALKNDSGTDDDGILFPRRFATDDAGAQLSSLAELAERAAGDPHWGILRGDVDQFEARLGDVASIEEHIHLSTLFKEFFAGELSLLCTMPDFWRKVSLLYRGGADFAVIGSWDALILLATELHRVFEKFIEQNAAPLPVIEGSTLSMALAIAPEMDTPVSHVMQNAILQLEAARAIELGQFALFDRALEWKRLADAQELKSGLVRLVRDFGYSPEYIHDLAAFYRESASTREARRNKAVRVEKPWRTYMRVSSVIPQPRTREAANVRTSIITNLVGKRAAGFKLRPSARVGLEWARLAASN
jgi:CRISPR-associated protein Csm1